MSTVVRARGAPAPNADVVLIGGVRTPSDALVGPVAQAAIATLHVDLLFIGVHGIDADRGLTTPNLMEAGANQAFMASARTVVAVADSTKWGVVGLSSFASLDELDAIVTDDALPEPIVDRLRQQVDRVILAGQSEPAQEPDAKPAEPDGGHG